MLNDWRVDLLDFNLVHFEGVVVSDVEIEVFNDSFDLTLGFLEQRVVMFFNADPIMFHRW